VTAVNVFLMIISFFLGNMFCLFGLAWKPTRIAGGLLSLLRFLSGEFKKRGVSKKVESDAQKRNDIALPISHSMLAGPGSISCYCIL
jgi:multiple antibiotic resistance protein